MMEIFSPAKINLFLGVVGERGDGFHELVSLVAQVRFGDYLGMELTEGGDEIETEYDGLPVGGENIIMKAIKLFRRRYVFGNGVRVRLDKRIPVGGGLGGGSSNAVAVLRGLNKLLGEVLREEEMREMGVELGSDCGLFFEDGVAMVSGRGEIVEGVGVELREKLRGQRVLIFKPRFSVDTRWAYGQMVMNPSYYIEKEEAEYVLREGVGRFLEGGDFGGMLYNNFERVIFEKHGELREVMRRLREMGVEGLMSGSGSACFCMLGEGSDTDEIGKRIKEVLGEEIFIVETEIY